MNFKWTNHAEKKLRILVEQGHSDAEICKIMGNGLTKNAVIGKRYRLGLARNKTSSSARAKPDAEKSAARDKQPSGRKGRHKKPAALPSQSETDIATMITAMPTGAAAASQENTEQTQEAAFLPLGITFMERQDDQCPTILRGTGASAICCGATVDAHKPLCAAHMKVHYITKPKWRPEQFGPIRGNRQLSRF